MKLTKLDSFPLNPKGRCNPFCHDLFHMGTDVGNNLVVMYSKHTDKPCEYVIIVDKNTGERYKVEVDLSKIVKEES